MPPPTASLPPEIRAALEREFKSAVAGVQPLGGGEVNHAVWIEFVGGNDPVFLKWHPDPPPGLFEAEADGLNALAATNAIRIPSVLLVSTEPAFLVLEFIPSGPPLDPHALSETFAEALASLHRSTLGSAYGYQIDNYLGSQPQRNTPSLPFWPDFYEERRIRPQIDRADEAGLLPDFRRQSLERLVEQIPNLLGDMPNEASLIHGDLWAGNFLCTADDRPVLIDPAVYHAPREMELAYVELFGGFPPNFTRHYNTAYPLDPGYRYRRSLHQLYPLLIHLNHFGEQYGPSVDRVCDEYL